MSKWIKVTEELPAMQKQHLSDGCTRYIDMYVSDCVLFTDGKTITCGTCFKYTDKDQFRWIVMGNNCDCGSKITHWMPCPALPGENNA